MWTGQSTKLTAWFSARLHNDFVPRSASKGKEPALEIYRLAGVERSLKNSARSAPLDL